MHIFSAPALKNCEPKNMWQKQTTDIFCDFSSGATKNPWSFQNGAAFETNFRTVSCRPPNHSPRIGTSADGIEANQGSIFQRPMVRWDQYDAIAPKNNQSHWIQEDSWIHLFVCGFLFIHQKQYHLYLEHDFVCWLSIRENIGQNQLMSLNIKLSRFNMPEPENS